MTSKFLPGISSVALDKIIESNNKQLLYDLLTQSLHEELYKRQSFDFLDELSDEQQLLLLYDYVQQQVLQGGFVQLIENGYIALLPDLHRLLLLVGAMDMAEVIDDALKLYVLNVEHFNKNNTVEDFAKLYDQLPEFGVLDKRYEMRAERATNLILQYTVGRLGAVAKLT